VNTLSGYSIGLQQPVCYSKIRVSCLQKLQKWWACATVRSSNGPASLSVTTTTGIKVKCQPIIRTEGAAISILLKIFASVNEDANDFIGIVVKKNERIICSIGPLLLLLLLSLFVPSKIQVAMVAVLVRGGLAAAAVAVLVLLLVVLVSCCTTITRTTRRFVKTRGGYQHTGGTEATILLVVVVPRRGWILPLHPLLLLQRTTIRFPLNLGSNHECAQIRLASNHQFVSISTSLWPCCSCSLKPIDVELSPKGLVMGLLVEVTRHDNVGEFLL
jgi:hypothetical protein